MNGARDSSIRRAARGQATAEFVLLCPLVVLLALAVVQVSVVAQRGVLVAHAAREGARAAAVEDTDAAAQQAALEAVERSSSLDASRVVVTVERNAREVAVTVRYVDPTDVTLIGPMLGSVTLQERVTMRREDQ